MNKVVTANEQYKGYGYAFTLDKTGRIVSLDITPAGGSTADYQVKYADVRSTRAGNIAHSIKVNATIEKKKLDFSLTYKNIDWNGNVKIDRDIPGGYTRMNAKDLFNLFSNCSGTGFSRQGPLSQLPALAHCNKKWFSSLCYYNIH